ncbi:MAG: hypothetical protein WBA68_07055 [Alteraurantiacibacter sp.]
MTGFLAWCSSRHKLGMGRCDRKGGIGSEVDLLAGAAAQFGEPIFGQAGKHLRVRGHFHLARTHQPLGTPEQQSGGCLNRLVLRALKQRRALQSRHEMHETEAIHCRAFVRPICQSILQCLVDRSSLRFPRRRREVYADGSAYAQPHERVRDRQDRSLCKSFCRTCAIDIYQSHRGSSVQHQFAAIEYHAATEGI